MNELGKKEIVTEFPKYLDDMARLEREWAEIPEWNWIRQWLNLRRRGQLNRQYQQKMKDWGLAA